MTFYNEENLEDLIDYECDNFEENSFEKGNKYCNIFSEEQINLDFNYTNYHVIYLSQVEWWLVQCIGFNTFYTFSENCNTLQFSDNIYLTVLLRGYYYGNVKIIPSIHQYY